MTAAQENEIRPPAHDELQPGAVGRVLREAREGYRQDLATVSQQLRIRSVYLKAIEEGRHQDLPGATYAVGFVRSYAEYLGLDPNEIVRRFRDEAAEVNRRTKLVFPVPAVEARVPSGALVLIALTVAVLAYGGWYYLSDRDRSLVDLVPSVPESLQSLVDPDSEAETDISESGPAVSVATADAAPVALGEDTETDAPAISTTTSTSAAVATVESGAAATAAGTMTTAIADPAATAATLDGAGADDDVSAATGAAMSAATTTTESTAAAIAVEVTAADAGTGAADAAATAADAQAAAAHAGADAADPTTQQIAVIPEAPRVPDSVQDGQDFGIAFGGSRVVIVARMESFLRVRDADGNEIWSRLLRSGDRYLVPERDGLTLTVGNAGGVDVFVDGRKAPALGAVGVGVTGISLDPDRLAAGTALP